MDRGLNETHDPTDGDRGDAEPCGNHNQAQAMIDQLVAKRASMIRNIRHGGSPHCLNALRRLSMSEHAPVSAGRIVKKITTLSHRLDLQQTMPTG